jgi:hypothetical protein
VEFPLAQDDPYYHFGALTQRAPRFFEKTTAIRDLPGAITVGSLSDLGT